MTAASERIPANRVFGTLRIRAASARSLRVSKRRAVTTSSHPIAQLASHNSGTTRTKSGGKGVIPREAPPPNGQVSSEGQTANDAGFFTRTIHATAIAELLVGSRSCQLVAGATCRSDLPGARDEIERRDVRGSAPQAPH